MSERRPEQDDFDWDAYERRLDRQAAPAEPTTAAEVPLNAAGGPLLEPHANGCHCWPHVSQSDAFRAVEHAALLEYRSKVVEARQPSPLDNESGPGGLVVDSRPRSQPSPGLRCNWCGNPLQDGYCKTEGCDAAKPEPSPVAERSNGLREAAERVLSGSRGSPEWYRDVDTLAALTADPEAGR